jgi:hypothetical protein
VVPIETRDLSTDLLKLKVEAEQGLLQGLQKHI